jgi:hypothetical protein
MKFTYGFTVKTVQGKDYVYFGATMAQAANLNNILEGRASLKP